MRPEELQEGWSGGRESCSQRDWVCKKEEEMCEKRKRNMFAINGTKNIKGR